MKGCPLVPADAYSLNKEQSCDHNKCYMYNLKVVIIILINMYNLKSFNHIYIIYIYYPVMLFSLGTFSAISLFILQVVHAIANSNTFGKASAHFQYKLYFLLNKVPTQH